MPQEPVSTWLIEMASSPERAQRLEALSIMRQSVESLTDDYLSLARTLIEDADNDCRWQALIFIGDFVKSQPDAVWQVACEFGVSPDDDMRTGVATVLLEHLLEHHFEMYLPKLRQRLQAGAPLLADTLSRCWALGQAKDRWNMVEQLIAQYG